MIKRKPKAVANATNVASKGVMISKNKKDEIPVMLKDENERKGFSISKGEQKIGMSKGMTIPTEPYANVKITVWVERIIPEGEKERSKNLQELSEYLDDWLIVESKELKS